MGAKFSVALAAFATMAMVGATASADDQNTIKMGVFAATGAGTASMAEAGKIGADYVFNHFNSESKGLKIEPVDVNIGAFDPATGVNSIKKAVLVDGILTWLSAGSPLILAVRPFVEQQKVVTFSIAGSEAVIKDQNYVQQVMPFWSDEIAEMGKYVCSQQSAIGAIRKVEVIAVGGAGGDSAVKAVAKWKDLCGIETVSVQRYSIPTTNFRPQLSALAHVPADAIYVASLGGVENTAIVSQARQLGIALPLLTPLAGPENSLIESDAGDRLYFTSYVIDGLPSEIADDYRKLGSAVLFGFYYASVATAVLDDMQAKNIAISRDTFRGELLKRRTFNIAGSSFCFNEDGHTRIPMGIWAIRDKKEVQLQGAASASCE